MGKPGDRKKRMREKRERRARRRQLMAVKRRLLGALQPKPFKAAMKAGFASRTVR